MKINVDCPTRVDLAGGTLDLWPLHSFLGSASTICMAIDIRTHVELTELPSSEIKIDMADLDFKSEFSNLESFLSQPDDTLLFLQSHISFWKPQSGFALRTTSESPVGGGLGGSSSLSIGLIEAFANWSKKSLNPLEKVELAHNIEAQFLRTPTGTQDYFAPILKGGLVVIDYDVSGIQYTHKNIPSYLEDRFLLVYTGRPHHSGLNNWVVLKDFIDGDKTTRDSLYRIKEIADEVKTVVQTEKWEGFLPLLREEYKARIALQSAFASPEIHRLNDIVGEFSNSEIKICGAGGGGCVMIVTDSKREISERCQKEGFKVLAAKPVPKGSR